MAASLQGSRILVSGDHLNRGDPSCLEKLREAHRARIRPRCLCVDGGVEMYISHVGDEYIVKRMPGTARRHARGCDRFDMLAEAYRPLPENSASSADPSTAVGHVDIRLAFRLDLATVAEHRIGSAGGHPSDHHTTAGLTLRGLLHFLWMEAELSRWSSNFEGKRNWGTVYRRLRGAAANKRVEGDPLLSRLLIPFPFVPAHREHIWKSTRELLAGLRSHPGRAALLIAEVKRLAVQSGEFQAIFKHLPFLRFEVERAMLSELQHAIRIGSPLERSAHGPRLIAIATFCVDQANSPRILKLDISKFDERWLPLPS